MDVKGVIVQAQEAGWIDQSLVLDWIKQVLQQHSGAVRNLNSMLILDSFCVYTTEGIKTLLKKGIMDLVVIPSGLTSMLQPLDVCINQPFKFALKQKYMEWMAEGDHQYMPTGKIKKPNLNLLCSWIKDAWDQILLELVKSFKKCSISNNLDGTEDEFIWDSADDRASSEDDGNNDESD